MTAMTEAEIARVHAEHAAEVARREAERAGCTFDAFICRFDETQEPIAL